MSLLSNHTPKDADADAFLSTAVGTVVGMATLLGCAGMWRYRRVPCQREMDDDRVQLLAEASTGAYLGAGGGRE